MSLKTKLSEILSGIRGTSKAEDVPPPTGQDASKSLGKQGKPDPDTTGSTV